LHGSYHRAEKNFCNSAAKPFAALIVVVLTSSNEPSAEVGATLSGQTRA